MSVRLGEEARSDTARRVETPEGVELTLDVAGPYPRALAWMVDTSLRAGVAFFLAIPIAFLGQFGTGLMLLAGFTILFLYPVLFEVLWAGATPGKRALGLAVVHRDGSPVGWSASVTRNLVRVADFLPGTYGLGLASMLLSRDFQRLGDLAAGTVVVHVARAGRARALPDAVPRAPGRRLTRTDRRAIDSFAARVGEFSEPRARELADLVEVLTGATGDEAVRRLIGVARWLRGER